MKITLAIFLPLSILFLSQSTAQQVTFIDVAESMGINHPIAFIKNCVSFADIDGDGRDDLSFGSIEGQPMYIYRNEGTSFTDVTTQLGLVDSALSRTLLWSDYDNDGDKDLFVGIDTHTEYSKLFRNDGGVLTDVTFSSGIGNVLSSCNAACWGDFNNDGWIDLYVTHYSEFQANILYKNNQNGTFTDVTTIAGVQDTSNFTGYFKLPLAVAFFDYNNDGWQDIYIENDKFTWNTLYENQGDGTFENVSAQSNSALAGFMMGVAIGDYDNNGYLDIYSSNAPWGNYLLKNNGDGTFTEVAEDLGLSVNKWCWGTNFFDYDNDSDLDLYVCASVGPVNGVNAFFENNGNGTFTELQGIGLDNNHKSFGMGVGDFNNDGYYDIAVNNQVVLPNLFQSSSGSNNWVKLNLIGVQSNRDGIGSWIEFFIDGNRMIRQTRCGISFGSQNSSSVILGAGNQTTIDSIRVTWAGSGTVDVLREVDVNQLVTLHEGETIVSVKDDAITIYEYSLGQNYPNPFNPSTQIDFSLAADSRVTLNVYSLLGEKVATLVNSDLTAGSHQVNFDAASINSGVYFYRIEATGIDGTNFTNVNKMILTK